MNLKDKLYSDIKSTIRKFHLKGMLISVNLPDFNSEQCAVSYKRSSTGVRKNGFVQNFIGMHEDKDFMCVLNDGSLVQAFYQLNTQLDTLIKGSLTYYPNPGLELDGIFELIKIEAEDEKYELTNLALHVSDTYLHTSNYMRIDYDPDESSYKEIIHPCTHVHIGSNNEFRLLADRIPFFSEFMDFLFYCNYKDDWLVVNSDSILSQNGVYDFKKYFSDKYDFLNSNLFECKISSQEMHHYKVTFGTI